LTTTTDNRKQQTVSKTILKTTSKSKTFYKKKGIKIASRPASRQHLQKWVLNITVLVSNPL
jgi:hypothetical protein